ncbi:MAG: GNAT family N-acetyltransferase, partial [Abitibacteriaceae bacterium]|nr:GNAT family N-acetyltransferase [Abditibacteriaceae bacterium]
MSTMPESSPQTYFQSLSPNPTLIGPGDLDLGDFGPGDLGPVPRSTVTPDALSETSETIDVEVRQSIQSFRAGEWDALVPRDEPQLRHEFLTAVERSGMGRQPTYITVRWRQRIVGVAVAYESDIDLLTLASPKLTRLANVIRKGFLKRLLILKSLSCGPVITNCRPNLYVAQDLTRETTQQVVTQLVQQLDQIAGGSLKVLFEYKGASAEVYAPALEAAGYIQAASLPGTQLDIGWASFDEYVGAMRKFYRRAVKHDLAAGEGLEITIERDFSALAAEACALYENTLARAQVVLERLTPAFFAALGQCEQARLVTARHKVTGKLVGIELLLVGDTVLQDLYTGLDYSFNEAHNLYFNLVYPGIDLACRTGLKSVSTGQTSYTFKSRLGVQPYGLSIFIKHRNPVVQALISRCKSALC